MASNSIIKAGSEYAANAEAEAGGTITPGMFMSMDANGEFVAHAIADGPNTYLIADLPIDPEKDKTDDYAAGEAVRGQRLTPGVKVEVVVGASQDLAPGDLLVSNGDGTLVERGAQAYGVVFGYVAEDEAVTTGVGETGRVEMWVI